MQPYIRSTASGVRNEDGDEREVTFRGLLRIW